MTEALFLILGLLAGGWGMYVYQETQRRKDLIQDLIQRLTVRTATSPQEAVLQARRPAPEPRDDGSPEALAEKMRGRVQPLGL